MRKISLFCCLMWGFAFALTAPALALATDRADIISALNTLPQLTNKITGNTTMAIVYDPAMPASAADAEAIKKIIDAGVKMPGGGGTLSAILVSVNEPGKLARAKIAFLTAGLAAHYSDINTATSAASILTMTTDIDCVRAAKCIIGVTSNPTLTIYYNKQAADNAKIEFSQAFTMLVKQP